MLQLLQNLLISVFCSADNFSTSRHIYEFRLEKYSILYFGSDMPSYTTQSNVTVSVLYHCHKEQMSHAPCPVLVTPTSFVVDCSLQVHMRLE